MIAKQYDGEVVVTEPTGSGVERRHLTVLFCDLVGSTALSTRLDPEELHEILANYRQCCGAEIAKFGGFVAKYMGDGVIAYFGYPHANEDDAERAVRAGLALTESVPRLKGAFGLPLEVRIGIATGVVLVGDLIAEGAAHDHDVIGETPNLAARLQALAEPNGVIISDETRRLVGELFDCGAIVAQSLKGFAVPVHAWRVDGTSAVESRFAALRTVNSRMIDRTVEVSSIMSRWQQAKAGNGCVVLISGEPGIGKSRVVQTLLDRISEEPHIPLRFFCVPNAQSSALYPVIAQLERTAGIKRGDTIEQRLDKLEAVLVQATADIGEAAPLIAELLSIPTGDRYPPPDLSPQKRREKTLQALVAQLEGLTRQPVVIVFEDVHWIDPTSMELLNLIVERVPKLCAMLIVTFRPDAVSPWSGQPQVTEVRLNRLPLQHRAELVAELTRENALSKATVERIVDRTDGIPLFIEELTKALVERGGDNPSAHDIPATLQDMLMARLDRLGGAKEVAQIASVIGNEFSWRLLREVAPIEEERLKKELLKLIDSEILLEQGDAPAAKYRFKHALIQDSAYQSLLRSKRQSYHREIGQALKARFPELVEARPELLAHHYTSADLKEEAIPYWQSAGEKSVRRSANLEAITHFSKALDLLKSLPASPEHFQLELGLQLAIGTPLIATKGFASPDVGRVYARARELCQQAGNAPQLFPVLWGLWVFYTARAEHETARGLADQCRSIADAVKDENLLMLAHHAMGVTLTGLGQFSEALHELEQAIAIYDREQPVALAFAYGQDSGVVCRSQAAFVLWFLGHPERALRKNDEALALAKKLSHPYSLAASLVFSAWLHQLVQNKQVAREHAEEALALSNKHEFVFWLLTGMILHGWSLPTGEGAGGGIAQMRQGVTGYQATGAAIMLPYYLGLLADTCGAMGEYAEAWRLLGEAEAAVQSSGERWWEAEVYRLMGEITLTHPEVLGQGADREGSAEEYFDKSLRVASSQGAKSLELRAAMSLARLRRNQGRPESAQQKLAEAYGWFTEGFDLADLQEARDLLEI